MKQYDVIVVGTGSANIVTDGALKEGLQVAQIEKGHFGGTCLNRGCIPTKVMVTAADYVREIGELHHIGVETGPAHINWERMSQRVWQKIDENKTILADYKKKKNLAIYQGTGYFTGPKVMQVRYSDGTVSEEFTADKIFIGAGARSNILPLEGLEEVGYLTSESLFGHKYPKKPFKSLIIIGGGPIGSEFAHVFAAAGTQVTLVQHNIRLLPKEDEEMSAQIRVEFRKMGIQVYLNQQPLKVRLEKGQKILSFRNRTTDEHYEVRADEILVATGITPNTDLLQVKNAAIAVDKSGWIRTNEFLETSVAGIWALGDVNGIAPFRHKANYEAEILVHNLFSGNAPENWRWARYDVVPAVTYTYPQVGHVGLTEQQAIDAGYQVKIGKHQYSSTAKGFAMGFEPGDIDDGFVKIIVNKTNDCILGMHIIGPQASILIQPFINLMNAGKTELQAVHEDIASPTVIRLRAEKLTRNLDPHSVISIGETMTPHPSLAEVAMWTQYYYENK
jgi:dihydrolipoamide dehydrogenase